MVGFRGRDVSQPPAQSSNSRGCSFDFRGTTVVEFLEAGAGSNSNFMAVASGVWVGGGASLRSGQHECR